MQTQINQQAVINLSEKFIGADAKAAAKFFESLSTHEALQFISPLKAEYITLCLENMTPQRAAPVLRRLPTKQAAHVTGKFNINFAAQVLELVPEYHKEKIKALLPKTLKDNLDNALKYPQGSVGMVMTNDFTAFRTDVRISEIVAKLKNIPRKKLPQVIFVTDKGSKFLGIIRTLDLVFFNAEAMAGSVMNNETPKLSASTDIKDAEAKLKESEIKTLPVVDEKNILLGVFEKKSVKESEKKNEGILSKFFSL
ncbi:magnesium transporter [Elusimicrobium posterum]|uniref:CBS domain-containing protein n=1 Tax=Elusimicrobium posterum TaxID=3116653 RepID=UPI003C71DB8C